MNSRMWILSFATLLFAIPSTLSYAGQSRVGTGDQVSPQSNPAPAVQPAGATALKQVQQLVYSKKQIGSAFELLTESFPNHQIQSQHATPIMEALAGILEAAQKSDEKALSQESLSYARTLIANSFNDVQLAGHGQIEIAYPFMQSICRVAHSAIDIDGDLAAEMFIQVGQIARNLQVNPAFPAQALPGIAANIVAEAKGYALRGNLEMATESLRLAFQWGFVDFQVALNDEVLCSIDEQGVLKQMTNQARESYKATVRVQVQNAIRNFGQFQMNFQLDGLKANQTVSDEDYRGKILVLDLGASWCAPCVKSIPHLKELQKEYGKRGVRVLNASFENEESLEENRKILRKFLEKHDIEYDIALGNEALKAAIPNFQQFPSLVFVDRHGNARYVAHGYHDYTQISTIVETLLAMESSVN